MAEQSSLRAQLKALGLSHIDQTARALEGIPEDQRSVLMPALVALANAGLKPVVVQGFRTTAQQNALYNSGRGVTRARGGQSFHNFGGAIDIVPASLLGTKNWSPESPLWKKQGEVLASVPGVRWGGGQAFAAKGVYDPSHVEIAAPLSAFRNGTWTPPPRPPADIPGAAPQQPVVASAYAPGNARLTAEPLAAAPSPVTMSPALQAAWTRLATAREQRQAPQPATMSPATQLARANPTQTAADTLAARYRQQGGNPSARQPVAAAPAPVSSVPQAAPPRPQAGLFIGSGSDAAFHPGTVTSAQTFLPDGTRLADTETWRMNALQVRPTSIPGTEVGPEPAPVYGMTEPGNIDVHNRPVVHNADGSISTVRSASANFDGQEVLYPTIGPNGEVLTDEQAQRLYLDTGQHLGKFKSPLAATNFAIRLHNGQDEEYRSLAPKPAGLPSFRQPPTPMSTSLNSTRGAPRSNALGAPVPAEMSPDLRLERTSQWSVNSPWPATMPPDLAARRQGEVAPTPAPRPLATLQDTEPTEFWTVPRTGQQVAVGTVWTTGSGVPGDPYVDHAITRNGPQVMFRYPTHPTIMSGVLGGFIQNALDTFSRPSPSNALRPSSRPVTRTNTLSRPRYSAPSEPPDTLVSSK